MLRPLVAVTATALLLAGCSGGDNDKSDSPSGDSDNTAGSTPTPSTPDLPSFDPPKGFSPLTAVAEARPEGTLELYPGKAGMVGKTTLYANSTVLTGVWIDGGQSWQVPTKDIASTKVVDFAQPVAVQLDGKEVISTAYVQNVEAGGTQKAHGQVNFQWIDPADGKVLVSVAVDLTPTIGPGNTGGNLISQAYDSATGQVAVGLGVKSGAGTKSKYSVVSAYADPKTKKGSVIPQVAAAGVLDGTVVGAQGEGHESATDLSIAIADGGTGAIKKSIPTPGMNYLSVEGSGGKRAYLSGRGYVQDTKYDHHYVNSLYAVDIASAAMVVTKLANTPDSGAGLDCLSDHVTGLVCTYGGTQTADGRDIDEIAGFDDTTGKKSWGYSSEAASRVVPDLTAYYNGYVYGQAQTQPAVLDGKTGQDIPVPTPTPGASQTPADGGTPTPGGTPSDDSGPTGDGTPTPGKGGQDTWGDPSLIYGDPRSPEAVSKYGSTYLLAAGSTAPLGSENILVVQKAIG